MKLTKKSKYAWLVMAVTASLLTSSYASVEAKTFTGDNQIIWGMENTDKKTFGSAVSKNIDGDLIYDFGEDVTFNNSGKGQPKSVINNGDMPGTVIIKNNVNVVMHSTDWSAVAVKAGWMEGNFDMAGDQRGSVTFEGDLTMRDKTVEGEWGVTATDLHGGFNTYKGARWQPVGLRAGEAGDIIVKGNLDMAVKGSALVTDPYYKALTTSDSKDYMDDYSLSTITTYGDVRIDTPEDMTEGFYSIANYGGTINVNTDGTTARDKTVVINGNILTMYDNGEKNSGGDYFYRSGKTNLALTNNRSSWTGVIDNTGTDQTGEVNLWLQNNATWNHKTLSLINGINLGEVPQQSAPHYGDYDGITHINQLTGGTSEAASGLIFQNNEANIEIRNYSGFTTVFYNHDNDGSSASDYTAGDVIIGKAGVGSSISLVTNSTNVDIKDSSKVNTVLNALAGKLTYSDFANNPDNLTGTVKIAAGLTSDSVILKAGNIQFSDSGKGSYSNPVKTKFETTLTGETEADAEYVDVIQSDGTYKFTEDSSINVKGEGAIGANLVKDTTIDASGKTLTINVTDASKTNGGLYQNDKINTTVTADKLVINLDSKSSGQGAHAIHQNDGTMTVNGNVDIDVKGDYSTVGVYSHAGSTTINGDVKVKLDGNHGGFGEYGAAGIYAHAGYGGAIGGTININGNVDISGVGNGLFANIGGATINVNGGKINTVDDQSNGYSAIYATCGAINMNVTKDADGKVTGAGTNDVDITGNVVASVGAVNYVDPCTETEVNLGLTTGKSQLTGVVYNEFPEGGKTVSQRGDSKTFTGAVNLWLQNGATWTNEQQGTLPSVWGGEQFNGSKVTNFVGGSDYNHAGRIFQKDSHELTIDNYSGHTLLVYAHDNDGASESDYTAGNTKINKATEGSYIRLSTNSAGFDVNDKNAADAAMKALASKLSYYGGDTNLSLDMQITGDSLLDDRIGMWLNNASFDENGSIIFNVDNTQRTWYTQESEFVQGPRSAVMNSMLSWRDMAGDTYHHRRAALASDEGGVWAKTYGGKNKYNGNNTSFKTNYWAGQVGYDKVLSNGWITGVAFDYRDGDDTYLTGDGSNKAYVLGFYGSKDLGDAGYLDINAKVGHVKNEFTARNEYGSMKGDYSTTGYSLSAMYGKRFGSDKGYLEPQVEFT